MGERNNTNKAKHVLMDSIISFDTLVYGINDIFAYQPHPHYTITKGKQ